MIVAVVGSTASGKSDFALDLAEAWSAKLGRNASETVEIVGADAMALYRGMDIGTAKLSQLERRSIAHHQIDVLDVHEEASVATYQRKARADIRDIERRGRLPLVVGGSGLYLRALLDRMEFPPTDASVRAALEERLEVEGSGALHRELAVSDPAAAQSIDPRNGRRVVRALEVIAVTGRSYSASLPKREYVEPTLQIGIRQPPDILEERIRLRTARMFQEGLVAEVEALSKAGLAQAKTASRATGYAQVLAMLAGKISKSEAQESIFLATHQLAKRQVKWFAPDGRIHWVDGTEPERALSEGLELVSNAKDAKTSL